MITNDEITMYICSYALFLKDMLVMNSFGTLSMTRFFPWHFPDC